MLARSLSHRAQTMAAWAAVASCDGRKPDSNRYEPRLRVCPLPLAVSMLGTTLLAAAILALIPLLSG